MEAVFLQTNLQGSRFLCASYFFLFRNTFNGLHISLNCFVTNNDRDIEVEVGYIATPKKEPVHIYVISKPVSIGSGHSSFGLL